MIHQFAIDLLHGDDPALLRPATAARAFTLGAGLTGAFTLGFSAHAMHPLREAKGHSANVAETVTVRGGEAVRAAVRVLTPAVSWAISSPTVAGVPIRCTYSSKNMAPDSSLAVQHLLSRKWETLTKLPSRSTGSSTVPALRRGSHRLRLADINASGALDASDAIVVKVPGHWPLCARRNSIWCAGQRPQVTAAASFSVTVVGCGHCA